MNSKYGLYARLQMYLPKLNNTAFAKAGVDVANQKEKKHFKNIRLHATKGSNSLSLLTFLHY
jgi:hypothetical protein